MPEGREGREGSRAEERAPHGGTVLLRVSHHPATRDKAAGKKNLPIVLGWPYFVLQAALKLAVPYLSSQMLGHPACNRSSRVCASEWLSGNILTVLLGCI